jgi:hypothetical protein
MCRASLPIRIWQSGFGLNLLRAWVKVGFVNGCLVLIGGTSVVAGLQMIFFEVEVEVIVVWVDTVVVDLLLFDFLVVTLSTSGLIRFVFLTREVRLKLVVAFEVEGSGSLCDPSSFVRSTSSISILMSKSGVGEQLWSQSLCVRSSKSFTSQSYSSRSFNMSSSRLSDILKTLTIKFVVVVSKFDLNIRWFVSLSGRHAEVVTFVAGSLEAGGLPGSLEIPEVLK